MSRKNKNLTFNDIQAHQRGPQTDNKVFMDKSLSKNKKGIIKSSGTETKSDLSFGNNDKHIQKELEGRLAYNLNIDKIDPHYSSKFLEFFNESILVRLLLLPGVHGHTINLETVAVPARGGTGEFKMEVDQYPYDCIGVVVNISKKTSEEMGLKEGDFVRVENPIIETKYANGKQYLKYMYLHHESTNELQYQGYVKIRPYDISNKLINFNLKSYVNSQHKQKAKD